MLNEILLKELKEALSKASNVLEESKCKKKKDTEGKKCKKTKGEEDSEENKGSESAAKWDTRFINSLPDMAFAVVESGYKEGGNKNARHEPHHNASVKSATENSSVDLPHYQGNR